MSSLFEHFNEFEKNHPDEYEFKEKKLMILIPKSSTFPKDLSRKRNGFHKVDKFCEIPINIEGEASSRVYNWRKPILLQAYRLYLDTRDEEDVESRIETVLFDFPHCLKSCIGRDDFDADVKRVNLRSFRKTIERYLEDSKRGEKLITFLEIDDSSDNMDASECMQENPVYTKAIHDRGKNQNFSKKNGKNLEEIITKDKID